MASANGNLEFLQLFKEHRLQDYLDMLLQKNAEEYIPLHWAVLN